MTILCITPMIKAVIIRLYVPIIQGSTPYSYFIISAELYFLVVHIYIDLSNHATWHITFSLEHMQID